MSEFDELVEGFDGLDADEKELLSRQIGTNASRAAPETNELVSHRMTVGDQSTADALDEILGAPSSMGEHRDDTAEVPGSTPGGLIDEPPFDPNDWPEEEATLTREEVEGSVLGVPVVVEPEMAEDVIAFTELRALRPDQRPVRGQHYVIYDGIPMPVTRDNFGATEDEFVRSQLDVDGLKDHDGQRTARADRALRLRFRGYVCGEMSSL